MAPFPMARPLELVLRRSHRVVPLTVAAAAIRLFDRGELLADALSSVIARLEE